MPEKAVGDVGMRIPAMLLARLPKASDELREWGGPALVRRKRVLDLGCGDGRFALGIAPYAKTVVGIDPDAELLASARERARSAGLDNVRFEVGAGQTLGVADGSVDVVILSWTL